MQSSTMITTRDQAACHVFGAPQNLPTSVLPTYADVMKYCVKIKNTLSEKSKYHPSFQDAAELVARDVEKVWNKASLPIVLHKRVLQLLNNYHTKYRQLLKPYKARKDNANYIEKLQTFRSDADILFDICTCKCDNAYECTCERERKVPHNEIAFLVDQRSCRKMSIGGVDKAETKRLGTLHKRKAAEQESALKRKLSEVMTDENVCTSACDMTDSVSDNENNDNDVSFAFPTTPQTPGTSSQMRVKLPALAKACDRHSVSDRAAATIASAALYDLGIIKDQNASKVIDRSKVRRERTQVRESCQTRFDGEIIQGLYFDGRKDRTMSNKKEADGKYHRKFIVEEHISVVREPGSDYFCHVTPTSGSSKCIVKALTDSLNENNTDLSRLESIGCDGTAVNTGHKGGVIRLLELHLSRPLQWFVCLLHANELPLRHLFQTLDGATTGPKGFTGPIGKALPNCEKHPIVTFQRIACDLPAIKSDDLSTDQHYMYDICKAVSTGECAVDVALRNPGALNHSRWLTTANRLCRLYVSTENPSEEFVSIITFIVTVYAPMWFDIKMHPACTDGARHVYKMIMRSRYMSDSLKNIIDPVIQGNSYFAHPENILIAMITDERPHMRKLGLRRILKARLNPGKSTRQFRVPRLNFDCADYTDMIDWTVEKVTEPPITTKISDEDLKIFINDPNTHLNDLDRFPCHTQAVERCIKLVTDASMAVCGQTRRDGFIRARLNSRKIMPKFETKKQHQM